MGRGFGRAKEQEPESYEIERRPVARYQPDHREGLTRARRRSVWRPGGPISRWIRRPRR